MSKNYYDILGVPRNSSDKEMRQAYRRLARKYHPDVNPGDKTAEARFKEANEAYEVLSDPGTRRKYDQFGGNWKYADRFSKASSTQGSHRWPSGDEVDLSGGLFDFEDSILGGFFTRDLFGSRRRRTIEYQVEATLEEAFAGTTRTVEVGGRQNPRRLEVKIPAGVDNGSRVLVTGGEGEQIILVVSVKPHPGFRRKGQDLYTEVSVPLYEAMLGGEVAVPTLKGRVMLKMPPETQNGASFRLSRKGMPRLGSQDRRGDLYVSVRVVLPKGLSEKERKLFQELNSIHNQGR